MAEDLEKGDVLSVSFCFICIDVTSLLQSQMTKISGKGWSNVYVPSLEEDHTQIHW